VTNVENVVIGAGQIDGSQAPVYTKNRPNDGPSA
jgi:hypothetical protein